MTPDATEAQFPVAVRTLGCKVNRVDSDEITAELLGRGVVLVSEADARVVVVNTCTVTGEADAKARKAVRQALRAPGAPLVVVTGCLAAVDGDSLRALGERVVVEADKRKVASRIAESLDLGEAGAGARRAVRFGEGFRTRAMLKIEDGCDSRCSYCIVPRARGGPRSVALDAIVAEARELVDAGVAEIVLTGINIGRYSDGAAGLADVVAAVATSGVKRLRLSSIEPPDLTAELLDVVASADSVCRHLHVPLQSGSDAVLERMNRAYTAQEYLGRLSAASSALPDVTFTTDVIAGLPGETDADHAETLALVESVGFSKVHVFRYSERPGTSAAAMTQVEPYVRTRRASELRALADRLRASHVRRRIGEPAEVLAESVEGDVVVGTTRDYLKVRVDSPGSCPGTLLDVVLEQGMVIG